MLITKYFQTDNNFSLIRLLSFVTVLAGLLLSALLQIFILLKIDVIYIREIIFLVSILLGFGFGGKVVQKFAEKDEKEEKI
jgi:positive regulator of sigma E activity